jgi:hypothetical protein
MMSRFTLFILLTISLLAGSCSGYKNKTDGTNLIPEEDLISILTDVYIADGLLTLQNLRERYAKYDSVLTYIHVIQTHGFTKTEMDKTMEYYFIKKPEKLVEIYDKVLADLSQRESLLEKEVLLTTAHRVNLWTGKDFYFFPGTSCADSTVFNTTLSKKGTYTLRFTATVFPDDESLNPGITGFLCNPDSITTGKRVYVKSVGYIKDGQQHTYSLSIKVSENSPLFFGGFLYNFGNNPADCELHAEIENISLSYLETVL